MHTPGGWRFPGEGRKRSKEVVFGWVDLAIGAIRSSDEIVDILRLICHASDNAADLSRYLDDVAEMIPAGGNARLMLEGGEILNGNSKIVIDIYDDTGNVFSSIRKMDDIADSRVILELLEIGKVKRKKIQMDML